MYTPSGRPTLGNALLQAEVLRGDPAGFARQQEVLNTAQQLVARAQAQVAAMEASTPSLEEVSFTEPPSLHCC